MHILRTRVYVCRLSGVRARIQKQQSWLSLEDCTHLQALTLVLMRLLLSRKCDAERSMLAGHVLSCAHGRTAFVNATQGCEYFTLERS